MNTIEILLVEDTPSDVRLTQEALKRSNLVYELTIVNDGIEALDYLKGLTSSEKKLPDVILLDLNMPRKNGHQVLDEIKDDELLRTIPVVLLTVSERDDDVLEALRLKMNYYIAKPITAEKLSALIKSINDLHCEQHDGTITRTKDETHIRLVLAGNPHTSPIALAKLANDPYEKVRCRVAENIRTTEEILSVLSRDLSTEVRVSVSENPKTPASVLALLVSDPCEDVRLGLSANPGIPQDLLIALAEDENMYVSACAKKTLAATSA